MLDQGVRPWAPDLLESCKRGVPSKHPFLKKMQARIWKVSTGTPHWSLAPPNNKHPLVWSSPVVLYPKQKGDSQNETGVASKDPFLKQMQARIWKVSTGTPHWSLAPPNNKHPLVWSSPVVLYPKQKGDSQNETGVPSKHPFLKKMQARIWKVSTGTPHWSLAPPNNKHPLVWSSPVVLYPKQKGDSQNETGVPSKHPFLKKDAS